MGGLFLWSDGSSYDGEYVKDIKQGYGVFHWPDGRCYAGQWEDGKMHGIGTYTTAGGEQYSGNWSKGQRIVHGSRSPEAEAEKTPAVEAVARDDKLAKEQDRGT